MSWPGGTGSAKELVTVAMVRGDDYKPFEQRIVRGNIDLNTRHSSLSVLSRLASGLLLCTIASASDARFVDNRTQ